MAEENKKKKLEDYEYELDDLMGALCENVVNDIKTFQDLINLDGDLDRELYLGDINYNTGGSIEGYIRFWNKYDDKHNIPVEERKPIKIYINSGGGSLTETFIMIDAISASKTPVWTIATGMCYSGGFFTLLAGTKRIGYPHSSYLYHEGSTSTGGDAHKFRNFAKFYEVQLEQLKQHTLSKTKITEEQYEENKKDDWWLTAEEALELGIIDEIMEELK